MRLILWELWPVQLAKVSCLLAGLSLTESFPSTAHVRSLSEGSSSAWHLFHTGALAIPDSNHLSSHWYGCPLSLPSGPRSPGRHLQHTGVPSGLRVLETDHRGHTFPYTNIPIRSAKCAQFTNITTCAPYRPRRTSTSPSESRHH